MEDWKWLSSGSSGQVQRRLQNTKAISHDALFSPPKTNHMKIAKLKEEFFKLLPPTIFFVVALRIQQ
jgi:hypothetical protein